ncbi:SET domain-containing protein [Xylariaceae sp. AK1471]|nr:SET domain-containing protein [Xylariaceae sp. AK1471]
MRVSSHCSWLTAALPAGHALQRYIGQDICSWNWFSSTSEQYVCPSIDVINSLGDISDSKRSHQADADSSPKSNVWITSPNCLGEYCVYTNNDFFGKGISLVTTAPNHHRVTQIQIPEAASKSDSEKTRVVEIQGKGKGLVATRTIRRGERIMAARPALLVHRNAFSELQLEEIYYLMDLAVNSLTTPRKESYLAQAGTMGGHKITDILFTNSFQISLGNDDDGFHYGNFPDVSLLNHDCRPNLAFYIDQNMTHCTHAVRDIKPGEELTISYIDALQVRSVRQERTRNSLGFSCGCSHCSLSSKESGASDARLLSISRIESELSNFKSQISSPAMVEEYVALYKKERLESKMAGAYTLAALNYNLFGKAAMAKKYARLSVEAGLLESGRDAPDVQAMRVLEDDLKAHWSWNMKRYQ